ncbi:SpaH/EbpB family LPXTG-anchored major pilin [Enterococcus sp.]|uniref:SpaH/EbpB family LPXTG-anchored major pilin n=1 Tax=Enterococcus sp. TaxID=35783 RepID=UPI00290885D8|nr:SpaH/EbpB family LPXTG-anchored major pilin [Enterococcus sp.]MDU5336212.1 SpaH/EbpB family LPXTG-anchored major pilin [Enterococcus sp.]
MKRLVRFTMILMLLLPTICGVGQQAVAAEADTLTFTLHKLVFPENGMPDESQNDGDERLKDYDGLNGVTYDVYDVTTDFYRLLQDKEAEEVQSELQNMDLSGRQAVGQQITATIGDKDGIANFSLPQLSGGKDAVYLFRESAAPNDVKSKAEDMIVALPVVDSTGNLHQGPIHLYPKNEINQPSFEKMIVDQQPSYQVGDQIKYELTTILPSSLSMYSKYLISDQADESLKLEDTSIKVQIETDSFTDYQLETSEHGFKLNFDLTKLKPHAGKKVTITYTMILADASKIDQDIINHAELETDFDKITRERGIKTGGKKFMKVDALAKEQTLTGAAFVVKNSQGEYLQENGGYRWSKSKEDDGIVKLTSNKEGFFEVKGLRYGSYLLEETKAPDGYQLSTKDVPFEVSENSYTFSKGILQVVNQKEPSTSKPGTPTSTKKAAAGSTAQYPKANDRQNLWLIVVGGIIVVVVLVLVFQRKARRSE